ncbi:cbb3-type cytochrome oxidase subunit 3 [Amnimonas aquatica]|nr:cbb3-type cytochrome c oxidase subunit 3 [Amnimonas aquatica]
MDLNMDNGTLHGIATLLAMAAFLSICWWAYKPSNRQRFEDNGRLPLDTDPLSPPPADKNARGDEK